MKNKILAALFIFSFSFLKSQTTNKDNINSSQIAGLCKVWGLVKFYHPDVTKGKIDWDKVLIKKYPEFSKNQTFESYNQKIIQLLDTLNQKSNFKEISEAQFNAIVNDKIETLDNFSFLTDTNKYINRISFSWINDSIFSKKTKYQLCKLLVNYKPYESKQLKGKTVVKHKENNYVDNSEGRVIALFIIEKDGSITNIKIKKGLNEKADNEVIRVLNLMPDWNPGIHFGELVRVRMAIPINFKTKKN